MSNIISAQNLNSENPVYAKSLSENKSSRFSQAPVSIPKYSIHQKLQNRDEFRRNVNTIFQSEQKSNEKTSTFTKFIAVLGSVCTFFILEAKKII